MDRADASHYLSWPAGRIADPGFGCAEGVPEDASATRIACAYAPCPGRPAVASLSISRHLVSLALPGHRTADGLVCYDRIAREPLKALHECVLAFLAFRIDQNTFDRADFYALGRLKVAHAFCAAGRINNVELLSLRDRFVRAFWLADITIDAFVGNQQGHGDLAGSRPRSISRASAG